MILYSVLQDILYTGDYMILYSVHQYILYTGDYIDILLHSPVDYIDILLHSPVDSIYIFHDWLNLNFCTFL